jgi:hypothetical protein
MSDRGWLYATEGVVGFFGDIVRGTSSASNTLTCNDISVRLVS